MTTNNITTTTPISTISTISTISDEYEVWDESGWTVSISAPSAEEAAEEYVDGGDWGDENSTTWHRIWVTDPGGETSQHTITVQPEDPVCDSASGEHNWCSLDELRNPPRHGGVVGHGGGVIETLICSHCAAYKYCDSWAQSPHTGGQGIASVSFGDADEASEKWTSIDEDEEDEDDAE